MQDKLEKEISIENRENIFLFKYINTLIFKC